MNGQLQDLLQLTGFPSLCTNPGMLLMWVIVGILLYLAVYKQFEPLLLVPIAFGALLANIPSENLVEKPAAPVISPADGVVIAAAFHAGDSFKFPQVPEGITEHLTRLDDQGIQALFLRESARRATGVAQIVGILRPAGVQPSPEELIPVKWGEGEIQICRQDKVLAAAAGGDVTAAVPVGTHLVKGATLLDIHSAHAGGLYHWISLGVILEIFPPLIFLGIGAMTDFGPLIANPKTLLLGAAAQLGIFTTFLAATFWCGFSPQEAAAISIIGGADGPTSIFLANKLAPDLMAAIAVAAYSYMALVPMIQPPIMRLLTTEKERKIRMTSLRKVGRTEKLVFAAVVTVLCILLVPPVAPLIGMLMLGNFLRESGVTERLSKAAQNELINVVTIFLGTSVGITMTADRFLRTETLMILGLGVIAFSFSTAGGLLMAKFMNLFLKQKINPLIGSAGVSAVPMAARVSQVEGQKADPTNYLLMHAMGPNVAGVIGSAIAAGFFLAMLGNH